MGLDITVVMADWERLARIPAAGRLEALTDAVYPSFCCVPCEEAGLAVRGGWVWPRQSSWCAEYRFFGTSGSYGWHVHLANAWGDMRAAAAPGLRDALDRFLGGLVGDGPGGGAGTDPDDDPPPAGGFPDDPAPWRPRVLLLRAPDEVPELVRAWELAAPRLAELREPFDAEALGWAGRPDTFDDAVALMREWGEVVTRAGARGWGLIGLPY
ncbi:hypothetical protein ACFYT4_11375 [Streptomyces sp. NPDC004609]|uniref:hypothetical protein n=1 Tax=Streptomyces sp. NPDC004609 TaxID=3364704 RepID=UPI00368552F2